ncbi:hypothetical protein Ahy_A01g001324 [Arachis hypogaea]|uniref:NAD(P)H dehydrogenase (quinone) n=1 Tax=Arachis hypogaea TaxID=3818 RepID=A0A445EMV3_ARAHY|nr:hypothetical protein Ahy_A01g001324 [Arachis hypogaea]
MYRHVEQLARQLKRGAKSVPETLPNGVLHKLNVSPKSDVPIIEPEMLNEVDGLIFDFPMRFRMMAAQFFDFIKEVKGGSPYGVGTYASDGTRQVAEIELLQAFHQENIFATITKKLKDAA